MRLEGKDAIVTGGGAGAGEGVAAGFSCGDEASMTAGVAMEVDGGRCV